MSQENDASVCKENEMREAEESSMLRQKLEEELEKATGELREEEETSPLSVPVSVLLVSQKVEEVADVDEGEAQIAVEQFVEQSVSTSVETTRAASEAPTEVKIVSLQDMVSTDSEVVATDETDTQAPLVAHHRASFWNCCGLCDLFAKSQS